MRNRTAIGIVYLLAIVGGLLPPIFFATYAYRQSVARIDGELEFVSEGVVARTDEIVGSIAASLREAAAVSAGNGGDDLAVAALRKIVFENRNLQGIAVVRDNRIVFTSEQQELAETDSFAGDPVTVAAPGQVEMAPPTGTGFAPQSMNVYFRVDPNVVIAGAADPRLLTDFLFYYAERSGVAVFVFLDAGKLLTTFGPPSIAAPPWEDGNRPISVRHKDGDSLVKWAHSMHYPISAAAVSMPGAVTSHFARTGLAYGAASLGVSALLVGLMIRIGKRTRSLEADLREAIRFGELDVFYQPIIDLQSGRCAGAEALMRWHHPRRGVIPAGEFITIAEDTGLILPMTDLMLEKIAKDLGALLAGDRSLLIGINLAPQHFASDDILESVRTRLHTAIAAPQIIYEITERGLVAEKDTAARRVMNGLIGHGSKLAVDDFGTGYSSLSYLERFPLDFLKIDKAFVDGISDAETSSGLVDQIIRIGRTLGMVIIAEGVEHDFQAAYLRARDVELAQGWFFARPLPAAEFKRIVRERNVAASDELPRV